MSKPTQNKLTFTNLDENKTYYLDGYMLYFEDNQWMFFGENRDVAIPFDLLPEWMRTGFLSSDLTMKFTKFLIRKNEENQK